MNEYGFLKSTCRRLKQEVAIIVISFFKYLICSDMGTYINDYKKDEDEMMWEIHEIRNELWNEIKDKSSGEINERSRAILEKWKKEMEQK